MTPVVDCRYLLSKGIVPRRVVLCHSDILTVSLGFYFVKSIIRLVLVGFRVKRKTEEREIVYN